jgi:hypothetical protein
MRKRCVVTTMVLQALLSACGGGGGGGGDSATGNATAGSTLAFTLSWDGPADLDLEVVTPSGRVVSLDDGSVDGCTLDADRGDVPGPLSETITCTDVRAGDYQARVQNIESAGVPAMLEITSAGASLQVHSFTVPAGGGSGPYRVTVVAPTSTPTPTGTPAPAIVTPTRTNTPVRPNTATPTRTAPVGSGSCVQVRQGTWCFDFGARGLVVLEAEGPLRQSGCTVSFDNDLVGPLSGSFWRVSASTPDGDLDFSGSFFGNPATSFSGIFNQIGEAGGHFGACA